MAHTQRQRKKPEIQFDPTKPYTTRDKRRAEIIHTLKNGDLVVVVESNLDGEEAAETYTANGIFDPKQPGSTWDLVNVPEERWAFIYFGPTKVPLVRFFDTPDAASAWIANHDKGYIIESIACLEFTDGQGLDSPSVAEIVSETNPLVDNRKPLEGSP